MGCAVKTGRRPLVLRGNTPCRTFMYLCSGVSASESSESQPSVTPSAQNCAAARASHSFDLRRRDMLLESEPRPSHMRLCMQSQGMWGHAEQCQTHLSWTG